jgi:hypothetical protein
MAGNTVHLPSPWTLDPFDPFDPYICRTTYHFTIDGFYRYGKSRTIAADHSLSACWGVWYSLCSRMCFCERLYCLCNLVDNVVLILAAWPHRWHYLRTYMNRYFLPLEACISVHCVQKDIARL